MKAPENLKMNQTAQDTATPEKTGEGSFGVEIVESPSNAKVAEDLQQLESAILHNTPLTAQQVLETEESLDSVKVIVGGEEMTIAEMKKIPDLEKNVKIWKEIEAGDFVSASKLSYINPHIAELLSKVTFELNLSGLTSITDAVAEIISKGYRYLHLNGLTSISDSVAEHLSRHTGQLFLNGLTDISDTVAEHLSRHSNGLSLNGLTSISDSVAEHLVGRTDVFLDLNGLTSISDVVAEHLSKIDGHLGLLGLTSVSHMTVKHLAWYERKREGVMTNSLSVNYHIRERVGVFKRLYS